VNYPCGLCSSRVRPVLASSRVDPSGCQTFAASGLSDRPCRGTGPSACRPDCPRGDRGLSAWHLLLADRPGTRRTIHYSRCGTGGSVVFLGLSTRRSRTVRPVIANRPPQPRGPSTWAFMGQLSPLLLESCFCFRIVWGLFLGLVGRRCFRGTATRCFGPRH
jgi:hypothetical protein